MEKFSLFDFVSFILTGCTFLILTYLLLANQNIEGISNKLPAKEIIIIPLLLIGYLIGHLLSLIGIKIEKIIQRKKTPWTLYLKNNNEKAEFINSKCISLFNKSFLNENKGIDIRKSDELYDMIYDYIELKGNNGKVRILYSQYGFFRNSSAVWFSLSLILLIALTFKVCGAAFVVSTALSLILYTVITLLLLISSVILCKKRKLLTMSLVYRTFFIMNFQDKNDKAYE